MTASPPTAGSERQSGQSEESGLLKAVELIGAIAAPVTVLTALLYYFGWVRTNAILRFFGADPDILAFGLPDYLTRSAGTAFKPLVVLLVLVAAIGIAARGVARIEHRWEGVRLVVRERHLTLRPLSLSLLTVGLIAVFFGAATAVGWVGAPPIWAALALACGALSAWLGARHLASASDGWRNSPPVERGLLAAAAATALFWATAVYSQQQGEQFARYIDANPTAQAEVTIHSADDLDLWTTPGVLPGRGKFPHTYRGLGLLYYANDRWLLLSGELAENGRHKLVVIRDDDAIRVELAAR